MVEYANVQSVYDGSGRQIGRVEGLRRMRATIFFFVTPPQKYLVSPKIRIVLFCKREEAANNIFNRHFFNRKVLDIKA
jgi:hypothetical protein